MIRRAIYIIVLLLTVCNHVLSQQKIGVIADTQSPIWIELLWSETERNVEATDTLFARLLKEPVDALFFLGDLVAIGSYARHWVPVDAFLDALHQKGIRTYAIPGNHEYSIPAGWGIADFYKRFPDARKLIEIQTIDSIAMVLLDTNYSKLNRKQKEIQDLRYKICMDSLQNNPAVKAIIVCTHQPPFTNSTGVSPDKKIEERLVPTYMATPKAVLFLSGHSHNLERFRQLGKEFLVIGGGGGLRQPLLTSEKLKYTDLMHPTARIRYFYVIIERKRDKLHVKAKGMNADDFSEHIERQIVEIDIR